ncbi:MAG: polysaccharide deacetylase family protein [Dehalococcoidia bacterium]
MNVPAGAKAALRRAGVTRKRAAAIRMCCERTVLARIPRAPNPGPRILCYHGVGTPGWGVNDVSPARFRRQLETARELGYAFVPASEIAQGRAAPKSLAVTFDDGLASVAEHAAPILNELCIPWTTFIVAGWADGAHAWGPGVVSGWAEVERLAAQGATIGSHSRTHPNFGSLGVAAAAEELAGSLELIRSRVGISVSEFAIPFGQSRDWSGAAMAAAAEAGYERVYAQSVDRRWPGTVPRTFITRFDDDRIFRAALEGRFDRWEEWY